MLGGEQVGRPGDVEPGPSNGSGFFALSCAVRRQGQGAVVGIHRGRGTMEASYDPQAVESRWYQVWEDAGVFRPEHNPDGEPFSIVIPPPNVTGVLHMGHALDLAIQDLLIRRKRMQGYAALWVPGTDHAGIATQNVVERELAAEGMTRHDLGTGAFIEQVWEWKARHGGRITEQIRRLGFSSDWSRERFTLDEGLCDAVRHVFVGLYDEGLIYRGETDHQLVPPLSHRLVATSRWSTRTRSANWPTSAIPSPMATAASRWPPPAPRRCWATRLWPSTPTTSATGTSIGTTVTLPLVGREIPIVADEAVDPEFGTGAVKVTPAHDPNDFEIGAAPRPARRSTMLDREAVVTAAGGQLRGHGSLRGPRGRQGRARASRGYLVGVEEHHHSVGHCYRCKTVIEPMSVDSVVREGGSAGRTGHRVPSDRGRRCASSRSGGRTTTSTGWRTCGTGRISRQIWWGHRIPAWYLRRLRRDDRRRSRTRPRAPAGRATSRQEPDVLDTWFSSALWPFSTLGWPEQTDDLERYYPNSVMVTGYDIIYFWVARMIKMGIHFMDGDPVSPTW